MIGLRREPLRLMNKEGPHQEQLVDDWWNATLKALQNLQADLAGDDQRIAAIGLTGQCPSFTLTGENGESMTEALLYSDNRATREVEELLQQYPPAYVHRVTGQEPSPFFILPKLLWLSRHHAFLKDRERQAYVLQPRDYIGWRLTGRMATDPTHAACTLLYDIVGGRWQTEWLQALGLSQIQMPPVLPSNALQGYLAPEPAAATGIPAGTPIAVGGADSLCAVYGSQVVDRDTVCDISGTSTCLHWLVEKPGTDRAVNAYPHVAEHQYCAEVGLNTTGAALNWIRSIIGVDEEDISARVAQVPAGSDGLIFLPHLASGERENPNRKGAFVGLALRHGPGHLLRSVAEGIAYGLRMRLESAERGTSFRRALISGGVAASEWINQLKADVWRMPVDVISETETTALGAAMLAAEAVGSEIVWNRERFKRLYPNPEKAAEYEKGYRAFLETEAAMTSQAGKAGE
nr:FGGY family carbohydrate kinase [Cohnella sp. REN36]